MGKVKESIFKKKFMSDYSDGQYQFPMGKVK